MNAKKTAQIEGLTFRLAIEFHRFGENLTYTIHGNAWRRCPGVYLVYVDKQLVYIGKYQSGIRYRWLTKKGIYHFKKDKVHESLMEGKNVYVFAEHEEVLANQIRSSTPQWINVAGIESHLVAECGLELPWNTSGKASSKNE